MADRLIRRFGVLAALIAGILLFAHLARVGVPPGRDVSGHPVAREVLADTGSPAESPPKADLTLVVFTDYQCPACRRDAPVLAEVARADGRVRIVYRDWPVFGERSEQAARVALAAAPQGIYPALHRRLMAEPRVFEDAVLREAVEASGGDWRRVQRALAERRAAIDRQLAKNGRDALGLGLPGTPGYLVGPILLVGRQDASGFRAAIARARQAGRR